MSEKIESVPNPMVGGDFILANTSSISQSTLDALARLSGISTFASFSSFYQLTSLTPAQIAALISSIEVLIAGEQSTIGINQTTILQLRAQIDTPTTGLRDVYNSTVDAYSTAVRNYHATKDRQHSTESTISAMTAVLCSMMVEDAADASTIRGYQDQYSTLMTQIQSNSDKLDSQVRGYNSLSSIYGGYVQNYEVLLSSFAVEKNPSSLMGISTNMARYIALENELAPYIQSTLNSISSLSFYSTSYGFNLSSYNTTYQYYSSLEQQTVDAINRLIIERSTLNGKVTQYGQDLLTLGNQSSTEFGTLRSQATTFYTNKRTQIQNQLLSFKLSVQEWKAFIGFLVSQLTIQSTNLRSQIDLLAFQISQIQTSDPTTAAQLTSQQQTYNTQRTTIQNVISVLNPLDTANVPSFASILSVCESERLERDQFIDARKALTDMEIDILQNPNLMAGYAAMYQSTKNNMEQVRAVNINNYMMGGSGQAGRWNNLYALFAIIEPQLVIIQSLGSLSYSQPVKQAQPTQPFYNNPNEFQILDFIPY
jgi:hypothetical protein